MTTASANERRTLRFDSFEQMLADAETLAASSAARTLGKWPLASLLEHLAMSINCSIDGFPTKAPWFIRLIGPLLKSGALKKLSPGIKLPKRAEAEAYPPVNSVAEALEHLKSAATRTKTERMTATHPAFGKMTHDEWFQLHLRHAELHLSFVLP